MKNILFAFLVVLSTLTTGYAQITSSEIRGKITDTSGEGIPGVLIELNHLPTGTSVKTQSNSEGLYYIPNCKPGGPYTLKCTAPTFSEMEEANIYLTLGETSKINKQLKNAVRELGAVEIVQQVNDPLSSKHKGAETNINRSMMSKTPTINRSIQDMTRLSPQAAGNSFAGSNYRLNNLSIDGIANNDAFGFQEPTVGAGGSTAAGSPGALSKTQPISLDAIDAIQVSVSPYNVKAGNFTGGNLNVVTRSGSNQTEFSLYQFYKGNQTTGRSADEARTPIESFFDYQAGFRLGGALRKNKLFYFVNYEAGRRKEPLLFPAGAPGSAFNPQDIAALYDTIKTRYGYDAGTYTDATLATQNDKLFVRLDYYINPTHSLIMRYNGVFAQHENLSRSGFIFNYGSQGFTHSSRTSSAVVELKSRWASGISNSLVAGFSKIHDSRKPFNGIFPHIEIVTDNGGTIFVGAYREAAIYQMHQKTIELTDNLTIYRGAHKYTLGTHNEMYLFDYHFVTPYAGRWDYRSLDLFYQNKPDRVRGTYNLVSDEADFNYNRPSADFNVILSSVYAQDDWQATDRLSLSYGLRLDGNLFPTAQNYAPDLQNHPVFGAFAQDIKSQYILSPRVGFNWDATGDNRFKLRGGAGIFAGRMPFAWSAYSYIYNGNQFGSIDFRPRGQTVVPLITENFSQLGTLEQNKREINLVDPNFKLPRVARASVAGDLNLGNGWQLTLEAIYTKNLQEAFFKTINVKDSTTSLTASGADTRDVFLGSGDAGRVEPRFANVFLLTNSTQGSRYSLSATLTKEFKHQLSVFAAYTYGLSRDRSNGVRVSPQANWEWNQTIHPNDPPLSYSNFDIRHRVISSIAKVQEWSSKHTTSVSLFFSATSGSPFTFVYNGDINLDASSKNDLFFVPTQASDINLVDIKDKQGNVVITKEQQWADLDRYINADEYLSKRRGQYVERNGARTPWNVQLDARVSHTWTLPRNKVNHRFELSADIFNLTNLLNRNWGRQYFVPNTTNAGYSLVNVSTKIDGNGNAVPQYTYRTPEGKPWQIDGISSRMQMQIGLRYSF
ncbi:MAG TPA: carboxypeptidase regulatory-like domain-containing protein [Luteibaculaceae bacterium]|nr:carboxypeptidase regulatory-like domain-containing protein [Luteibaculaceae bacterium]